MTLPAGEETYVLCRTASRKEKEKAIRSRFSTRMETALNKLKKRVAENRLKDRNKIERQIGRIQARHPQVADLYQMEVKQSAEGLQFEWTVLNDRHSWQQLREGAYLLRTNLSGESAEDLWKKYIQLTEAEAAFRALKSELSIRPIFHQLERRVKAHVLVAFLGYALWVTLKHLLARKNLKISPAKACRCYRGCAVPTLFSRQPTDGRSDCAESPLQHQNNKRCSPTWAWTYPNDSILIMNVVQTQRCDRLILKD